MYERRIASGSTYVYPLFYSMYNNSALEQIKDEIAPLLDKASALLVEALLSKAGKGFALRLLVDKPGGITAGECSALNKQIYKLIVEKGLLAGDYSLEVSSPGLDRPLKDRIDFKRAETRAVDIWLSEAFDDKSFVSGNVREAGRESLRIQDSADNVIAIPYTKIKKAMFKL